MKIEIKRLGDGPIIKPNMDSRMGDNINGPSLIEVPEWVVEPLGRYYLYFAHHDGRYIRMAYANELIGPWRTYEAGVLPLEQSHFKGHVASPDVQVDHNARQIRMHFHGSDTVTGGGGGQFTRAALSTDGLEFQARPEILGNPYMRTFQYGEWHYAIAMPGTFYRSPDGLTDFETGPELFEANMRHAGLLVRDDRLLVFYTRIGDRPERIVVSEIDLSQDWSEWSPTPSEALLKPERDYEGANLDLHPSVRGIAPEPMHELRDPALFDDGQGPYLLYSVAGENGIAIARLTLHDD